jgi:hypothetical protein
MAKKNDVDLQTFQIYQDEETHDHPPEEAAPKKKKFGISFKKKEKAENAIDNEKDADDHPSDSVSVNSGGNAKQILIGLALGIAIVALVVIVDKLMK